MGIIGRSAAVLALGMIAIPAAVASPVAATDVSPDTLAPGFGQYLFTAWDGPPLRIFYSVPDRVDAETGVLIVLHGVKRDADRYRDEWRDLANAKGMILAVPEYSAKDFPGTAGYNGGNFKDARGGPRPRNHWSFAAIEPLFDDIRKRTGSRVPHYSIYGHSAGAQFVHRFVTFVPEARYSQAIAANAGWYTMPDLTIAYPYGLGSTAVSKDDLKRVLTRPLVILLGTSDTDPNHANLRRTREAMDQGPHRLARGRHYYTAGQAAAKRLGADFGWELREVSGVAHQNSLMAKAAADLLGK